MSAKAEINITPLVDVVLVLLIIFMIMTPLLLKGYSVNVPAKNIPPAHAPKDTLIVSQDKPDFVFLNREEIAAAELQVRLHEMLKGPNDTVFFSAGDELQYGIVMQTMDVIRNSGAENISILTSQLAKN